MTEFPAPDTEITHILIVDDVGRSRAWYLDVLGASLYREYGGTSVVLRFAGAWLLLTTGGPPTDDKPGVTLAAPRDPATARPPVHDPRRRLSGGLRDAPRPRRRPSSRRP